MRLTIAGLAVLSATCVVIELREVSRSKRINAEVRLFKFDLIKGNCRLPSGLPQVLPLQNRVVLHPEQRREVGLVSAEKQKWKLLFFFPAPKTLTGRTSSATTNSRNLSPSKVSDPPSLSLQQCTKSAQKHTSVSAKNCILFLRFQTCCPLSVFSLFFTHVLPTPLSSLTTNPSNPNAGECFRFSPVIFCFNIGFERSYCFLFIT